MPARIYYAHSVAGQPKQTWQVLPEHLAAVAIGAARQGAKFGAARAAFLAGLLHDLGKYSDRFQRRLDGGSAVDHATAGVGAWIETFSERDARRWNTSPLA